MKLKTNLTQASNQWAMRPADQRFWTPADMAKRTKGIHDSRKIAVTRYGNLVATCDERLGLRIQSRKADLGVESAAFSHWGFSQFAEKLGAPAGFLRDLKPATVAVVLNERLGMMDDTDREARVCIRTDMALPHVECFTSGRYGYIPNFKIAEGLVSLEKMGWRTAPARPYPGISKDDPLVRRANKKDLLLNNRASGGAEVKEGDLIAPAGLYAGDRDMFAFLICEGKPIDDGSGGHGLNRGIFVSNSEIGAGAFTITTFLYDAVCGNHIVWGAEDIHRLSIRHLGNAEPRAFEALERDLQHYIGADASALTNKMKSARKLVLGKDRKETTETLFNNRGLKLGLRDLEMAYDLAEHMDGERVKPNTVWGMVCGVTRLSQTEGYTNHRTRMDATSARLMALVN